LSRFQIKESFYSLLLPAAFFIAVFFYILWRLDPALYYQIQVPPFLWDSTFFQQFLAFPGGLVEYLSNLFSQFYYYPWIGAFVITTILVTTFLLSRALLNYISPDLKNSILTYIPTVLLLIMFSQYEHRLTYTLAWLQSLLFFLIYMKLLTKPILARLVLFFILATVLYFTSAGFMLFFAVLAIIAEVLYKRHILLGLVYFGFIIFLPFLAHTYLFILTTQSAYFYLLAPIYDYRPFFTPYLLYLYFPALFVAARLPRFSRIHSLFTQRISRRASTALLFVLTIAAAIYSFDAAMHKILQVDYYARHLQWNKLLEFVERHPTKNALVVFQTNRALYHTGKLSSDMFAYNQNWGVDGLFLPEDARKFFSIQVSDLYWDMGFLNEAQHWVLEDHTNFSYSPWHVQRLALINILNGEPGLANMCLDALSKTILYRDWAQKYRHFVADPQLFEKNSLLAHVNSLRLDENFIINPKLPEEDMSSIVAQNPENAMAFEYMMANYMLTFRLGPFVSFIEARKDQMARLPRHYQEAVIVYLQNTGWRQSEAFADKISPQTIAQFNDFVKILQNYHGNLSAAREELRHEYGHTYWYYSLYNNPSTQLAPS
jgi:hypothetical protein